MHFSSESENNATRFLTGGHATSKTIKLLHTVSRPEFLPANSASLIIGLSWGLALPVDVIWELIVPLALAFAVITLVAAFAAQINTLSYYKLDLKDESKKELVQARGQLVKRLIRF
jgi:hypothetical protein